MRNSKFINARRFLKDFELSEDSTDEEVRASAAKFAAYAEEVDEIEDIFLDAIDQILEDTYGPT